MSDLVANIIVTFLICAFVIKLMRNKKNYNKSREYFVSQGSNNINSDIGHIKETHHTNHEVIDTPQKVEIDNTWNDINTNPSYSHIPSNIYYDTFNNHSQH